MKTPFKKFIKIVALFFILLHFAGCAVAPISKNSFSKSSKNGLLVGSITFPNRKPKYTHYFVRATDKATPEFKIDRTIPGQLDDGRTYLFAIERPVGKYEISSFRFVDVELLMAGHIYFGGFSIPYESEQGKITYIGNIICNDYATANDTLASLQNHFERDIKALRKIKESSEWDNALNNPSRKIEYTQKKAKK